jgi:hypothetical protein
MVDRRWRRTAALLLVPAVVACASLAGCSGAARPAALVTSAGPFSTAKLRGALLTRVNGVKAVAPAAVGDYSSLPNGSASTSSVNVVRVIPKACGGATMTGFNPAVLAGSPAADATFLVGKNGVSEMLVASSARVASHSLAGQFPAACAHYRETVDGMVFGYRASQAAIDGIGKQALVLNVRPARATVDDLWSLVYRGTGFVGSVTVVGPNASEAAVRELGEQAYAFAAKSLS